MLHRLKRGFIVCDRMSLNEAFKTTDHSESTKANKFCHNLHGKHREGEAGMLFYVTHFSIQTLEHPTMFFFYADKFTEVFFCKRRNVRQVRAIQLMRQCFQAEELVDQGKERIRRHFRRGYLLNGVRSRGCVRAGLCRRRLQLRRYQNHLPKYRSR